MAGLDSPDSRLRTNPCPKNSVFHPSWGFPSASNFTPPSSPLHLGTLGHSFEISDVFSGPVPGPPRSETIPLSISGKSYHFSLELNLLHVGPRIDRLSVHEAFYLYRIAHNLMSSAEQGPDIQPQIRHTHTHTHAHPYIACACGRLVHLLHTREQAHALLPPGCGQGWCRSLATSPDPRHMVPVFSLEYSVAFPESVGLCCFSPVLSVIDQRLAVSHQPIVAIHHTLSWEGNFPTFSSQ